MLKQFPSRALVPMQAVDRGATGQTWGIPALCDRCEPGPTLGRRAENSRTNSISAHGSAPPHVFHSRILHRIETAPANSDGLVVKASSPASELTLFESSDRRQPSHFSQSTSWANRSPINLAAAKQESGRATGGKPYRVTKLHRLASGGSGRMPRVLCG